jgi:flavin-dependent dehydrogenase
MDFDFLIIGAGPAGSFAAELLAKGGAKVALFDGRPEGEPKACGGGVTAKALKAWPHLLNAVGRTITSSICTRHPANDFTSRWTNPSRSIRAIAFDCYLRDRARDAGAHVISEKISARKTKRTRTAGV